MTILPHPDERSSFGRFNVGDVVAVRGQRGRFVIKSFRVDSGACKWVSVYGGPKDSKAWRSFTVDRLRKVRVVPTSVRTPLDDGAG